MAQATTNNHAAPSGQPDAVPGRPLRARRVVDEAGVEPWPGVEPLPDDEDRPFSLPLFDVEDRGLDYDPVTAPVPALDVTDGGFGFEGDPASAFGGGTMPTHDDVLIRAGQAFEAGNPTTSPEATAADDRRSRRRQKRRQGSS